MTKKTKTLLGLLFGLGLAACQEPGREEGMSTKVADGSSPAPVVGGEQHLSLDQVPELVKAAALASVPGFVIEQAEREVENGVTVYCLEGRADGTWYDVDVTPDGTVVEVDGGSGDDEDDEDDDGEDGEDGEDEGDDDEGEGDDR